MTEGSRDSTSSESQVEKRIVISTRSFFFCYGRCSYISNVVYRYISSASTNRVIGRVAVRRGNVGPIQGLGKPIVLLEVLLGKYIVYTLEDKRVNSSLANLGTSGFGSGLGLIFPCPSANVNICLLYTSPSPRDS